MKIHIPELTVRTAKDGAKEILYDDFVFVRINYDYRYTDNAHRAYVTQKIYDMLKKGLDEIQKATKTP